MRVKYVVVVLLEGLDHDGFVNDVLSKYGIVTEFEDKTEYGGDPIRLYYMEGTMGQFMRIKLDLNCVTARQYILFPMKNLEEKRKMEKIIEGLS